MGSNGHSQVLESTNVVETCPNNCAGCKMDILGNVFLSCKICTQTYDLDCANVTQKQFQDMSVVSKKDFECPACQCRKPKFGNINTPVGSKSVPKAESYAPLQEQDSLINLIDDEPLSMNENITYRPHQRMQPKDLTFLVDSIADESITVGCIRTVIRDEFERIIDERLMKLFRKYDEDQIALHRQTEQVLANINKKMTLIECRVADLEGKLAAANKKPSSQPVVPQTLTPELVVPNPRGILEKQTSTEPVPATLEIEVPISTLVAATSLEENSALTSKQSLHNNASVVEIQHPASNAKSFSEAVKKPKKPSKPQGIVRGSAKVSGSLPQLVAAEQLRYIHLYYVQMGTTVQKVKDYIISITDAEIFCSVEPLRARGHYASFKIGVPSKLYDSVMTAEMWPEDVCIKPWTHNFRQQSRAE